MENNAVNVVVTRPTKSVGTSVLLTLLFGSLGLFYSTLLGGFLFLIFDILFWLLPMGWLFALVLLRPIQIIWGILAVRSYNKKLMKGKI